LDLTGLEVKGHYSDGFISTENIIDKNISGFDSSSAVDNQILTINVNGATTTYVVKIIGNSSPINNYSSSPIASSITISPVDSSVVVGSTLQFTSNIFDQNGCAISSDKTWVSSFDDVGSIDSNGLFTALKEGTTVVTVSSGSLNATTFVNVIPKSTTTEVIATTTKHVNSRNQDLTIGPDQSGTYILDTEDGEVILDIQALTVNSTTTFSINLESLFSNNGLLSSTTGLVNNKFYNFTAKDLSGKNVKTFKLPLKIILPISKNNLKDLGIYYFDEVNQKWVLISGAVFSNNKADFGTNHFTKFAILGTTPTTVLVEPEPEDVLPTEENNENNNQSSDSSENVTPNNNSGSNTGSNSSPIGGSSITDSSTTVSDNLENITQNTYENTIEIAKTSVKSCKSC
jgi:hypothetical protein